MNAQLRIRCRPIDESDLDAVADLLARGFPARPRRYWARGLARLARREVPVGYPRFGFLLDLGGKPVGAILLIAQAITHGPERHVRCNLASWYVEPAYRSHAAMLAMVPLRYKSATLLNVSAAPNTWPTIEAQGFQRYTSGQRFLLPLLGTGVPGARLERFGPAHADLPEATLLADHAGTGCWALVGTLKGERVPFVFMPVRARQGRVFVPAAQLVFARQIADLDPFALPLGRWLLRRGRPMVLVDTALAGGSTLPGFARTGVRPKFVRGVHRPALGDLAYTEFTIFGP